MDDSFSMIDFILQSSELPAWELWWGALWPVVATYWIYCPVFPSIAQCWQLIELITYNFSILPSIAHHCPVCSGQWWQLLQLSPNIVQCCSVLPSISQCCPVLPSSGGGNLLNWSALPVVNFPSCWPHTFIAPPQKTRPNRRQYLSGIKTDNTDSTRNLISVAHKIILGHVQNNQWKSQNKVTNQSQSVSQKGQPANFENCVHLLRWACNSDNDDPL